MPILVAKLALHQPKLVKILRVDNKTGNEDGEKKENPNFPVAFESHVNDPELHRELNMLSESWS